jgi:hypothetical protein
MHTKIITQQKDPNFLTHVMWLKSSLVVQYIHLELLWNLSYATLKKNKHNSRIIISGIYKIVIIHHRCALALLDSVQRLVAKP